MPKQLIFIMCDTQNKNMLSCYDNPVCETPNLDAMANEAAIFENGYTCQPVCGPARSAIFTGMYPSSNGVYANGMQLGKNVKNAGEYIKEAGIHSAYIGKWHLDGGDYFGYGECPEGYDPEYWYDMRNYIDEFEDDKFKIESRKNMGAKFFGDVEEKDTYAYRCASRAVDFIEKNSSEDFFLTVSFDEPHDPSRCPVKYRRNMKYKFRPTVNTKASLKNKPDIQKMWAKKFKLIPARALLFAYNRGMLACNRFVDDQIGRIFEAAKRAGIDPVIIYTADHGDMAMAHGLLTKGAAMYNETNNIPYIIKGDIFKNRRVTTPVSHVDLLPTILDYFGVKKPQYLEGESLYELNGDNEKRDVFAEFFRFELEVDGFLGYQPIRNIFEGRYKLNINLHSTDELYDLEKDPYEMNNLIDSKEYEAIRNDLHDRILDRMNRTRDPMRGYVWACRPWRKDKKPSFANDNCERQIDDGVHKRLSYSTGLPITELITKKGLK